MGTIHFKAAALYLGDPAVPIGEAAEAMLDIEFDTADDSAFTDTWDTNLKGTLTWAGAAQANFDTASSRLYDVAVSSTLSRLYLYPDRTDPSHYHGRCWPKITIDGARADAGRVSAAFKGSGALAYVTRTTYQAAVLADSPYLYLPLNDAAGPTATDLSGNDRHGTYAGTIAHGAAGCSGATAINLNGSDVPTNGYISLDAVLGGFNPSPHAFTVEFWAKPVINSGLYFDAGNSPRFLLRTASGSFQWADNSNTRVLGSLSTAACQHVAVVVSGQTIRAYINGAAGSLVDMGAGFTFGTPFASAVRGFGAHSGGADALGIVSDLAIYDTALTGTQILTHYQAA